MTKPQIKPKILIFLLALVLRPPGWSLGALNEAVLGRSHRAAIGLERLRAVIDESKDLLNIPKDYRLAIVPGSDTGAIEMAMWSLLGQRGIDVLAWENFGQMWVVDIVKHLKLKDHRVMDAPYGELPGLELGRL